MSRFRKLVENINDIKEWLSQDSSFINRLKKGCGITDDINKGGLIRPDGTLINCFPDPRLSHYDSLPFIYPEKIAPEEYGNFEEQDIMTLLKLYKEKISDKNISSEKYNEIIKILRKSAELKLSTHSIIFIHYSI